MSIGAERPAVAEDKQNLPQYNSNINARDVSYVEMVDWGVVYFLLL